MPMSNLKARIEDAKPLGVIRVDADLLIVYDGQQCSIPHCDRAELRD